MKIAIKNGLLLKNWSVEESLKMIKDAGFDGVELDVATMMREKYDPDGRWSGETYLEEAKKLGAYAKELGLTIVQASGVGNDHHFDFETVMLPQILRSIEISAAVGAPYVIIPALTRGAYRGSEEKFFESNMEFYGRLADTAKACGIKIALENQVAFDWAHFVLNHHVCSRAEEFCRYIDTLNETHGDLFVACVNPARAPLTGQEPEALTKGLGDRMKLVHMNDNDYRKDNKAVPGYGALDINRMVTALKDASYKGYFTLQVSTTHPAELMPSALAHMAEIARYWAGKAE